MPRKKLQIPDYGKVRMNGKEYYRTRIEDADGKRIALYASTKEELYRKEMESRRKAQEIKQNFEENIATKEDVKVKEYCEKWILIASGRVRSTTLKGYVSKINKYIIKPLGEMSMNDVTADDISTALLPAASKSKSVNRVLNMLVKSIFKSAVKSHVISENPAQDLKLKGIEPKEKKALTDEQVDKLLKAIKGLPPYAFVMIGLYTGLRREEILALEWENVYLDVEKPYLSVKKTWHVEKNRPIISDMVKSEAAYRKVPLPTDLLECLKEEKKKTKSKYVICNSEGKPLSYTQFKRLWQYIITRSTKERTYTRYVNGKKEKHTVKPVLGEKAAHNGKVTYCLDFYVTPHQLRHTYITNLIYKGIDPKTVQGLAGHKHSRITMDIYAKMKYNRPEELYDMIDAAFKK